MSGAILLSTGTDPALAGSDSNDGVFRTVFPDRSITTQAGPNISYAVVWKPPPGLLASLPNLRVIFSLGAGVDHILRDEALPDIPLVRFVDADLTGRMAEWVVLQVLSHHRKALFYRDRQHAREWADISVPAAHEITVGIMGFGVLGQAAARALMALGYRVAAWSRSGRSMNGVDAFDTDSTDAFFGRCDMVVCLLPLTPDTTGLIDTRFIDRLKQDGPLGAPVLMNAGRGGSQVDGDIAAALHDGRLGGASLDVFQIEPLPADSPLWDAPNCIVTPHAAAESDPTALARYVQRQIERFESGQALENVVDRDRGY